MTVINPFTKRWIMEPKSQDVWGIPHSLWFFAMGVGGALFINRALLGMELGRLFGLIVADLLSIVLISIGGLILIADLGKPFRVLRALMNPKTSWISIGAICDFIFLILDGLWVIADLEIRGARPLAELPWAGNSPLGVAFQVIAGISAFVVIIYPGLVLAYSPSIPFWNTTLIPLEFLAFAFSSAVGLAILSSLWAPVPAQTLAAWANLEISLLAVSGLLLLAHLLNGAYSHATARLSVDRLVKGELRVPFVFGTLFAGVALPLVLTVYGAWLASPDLLYLSVGGAIALAGNWLSKYTVIKAGTYAPFL